MQSTKKNNVWPVKSGNRFEFGGNNCLTLNTTVIDYGGKMVNPPVVQELMVKNDTSFISIKLLGGQVSPAQLRKLADELDKIWEDGIGEGNV